MNTSGVFFFFCLDLHSRTLFHTLSKDKTLEIERQSLTRAITCCLWDTWEYQLYLPYFYYFSNTKESKLTTVTEGYPLQNILHIINKGVYLHIYKREYGTEHPKQTLQTLASRKKSSSHPTTPSKIEQYPLADRQFILQSLPENLTMVHCCTICIISHLLSHPL